MVGKIPFWVDEDGWNALKGSFLQQDDAHAGLAGAGHTGDDRVGGQVGGIVKDRLFCLYLLGTQVVNATKIEFRGV